MTPSPENIAPGNIAPGNIAEEATDVAVDSASIDSQSATSEKATDPAVKPTDKTPTELDALYSRIQNFSLDTEGEALSFSQRLAADNGWPLACALDVIEEY